VSTSCALQYGVEHALAQQPPGQPGIVAVSGGPDSVALLRAVLRVRAGAAAPVVLAHLNHQLRGDESAGDEEFVHRLHEQCLANGTTALVLRAHRLDTRALAAGDNLESAARRLRYDWLTRVAHETGAAWVATGHTADDQAETVLHRLLRGTGLRGLSGIPERRALAPGVDLVRPLLHVRRSQVLAFLQQMGQEFRVDSSNEDRRYTRNRLRHELLPLLAREFNPAVVDVLGRLSAQASEVRQLIEDQAVRLLAEVELPRAGVLVILEVHRLAAVPALLVREVLRLLWRREGWPLQDTDFDAWQRAAAVVCGEMSAVDMPGGVRLRRVRQIVQLKGPGEPGASAPGETLG
jgi:tRNA(Ile)-lysidine synthase